MSNLNSHASPLRKKDVAVLYFFGGLVAFMLPLLIFFIFIPSSKDREYYDPAWVSTVPTFRMTFATIQVLFSAGFAIQIFKKYKVNYMFIFELSPSHKITHI